MKIRRVHLLMALAIAVGAVVAVDFLQRPSSESVPAVANAIRSDIGEDAIAVQNGEEPSRARRGLRLSENMVGAYNDHPLFRPDRSPRRASVGDETIDEGPDKEDFLLVGVVRDGGGEAIALVKVLDLGATIRALEGDDIGGWRVAEIADNYVLLERSGDFIRLDLTLRSTTISK